MPATRARGLCNVASAPMEPERGPLPCPMAADQSPSLPYVTAPFSAEGERVSQASLIGGDHLVADPLDAGDALRQCQQRLALGGRPDQTPNMHDTVADRNIAAAKIGPGLLL